MKRYVVVIIAVLIQIMAHGQNYGQTCFELAEVIPENRNVVYEATTSIKLLDGFRCNPDRNNSVLLSINRFGVFPPEEGLYGGPSYSGGNGVVGALPGELNVSELGGAVYSIPVLMPSGLGKMTPDIAITYNNQAGNGLLGWGWNLSGLSSIVRCGQTEYHDHNSTAVNFVDDRFAIDGKRLMLCTGNYGENGSIYKTEVDEMSKIVAYSNGYNGPSHFIVHKQDGTIWEYGCSADSRIEPQNRNDVVMTWLVNKIIDRDGNYILFKYIENQSDGEWYLNTIDYTLNDNAGVETMYRVQLVYDDRADVECGYGYTNVVQNKKILANILIINMMTGSTLYEYSFDYLEPGSYDDGLKFMYNRLNSIGLTADGLKLNPTKISWNSKRVHYPEKFMSHTLSKNVFNKVPFIGDFNGDGYSDVALVPYKTGSTYQYDVLVEVYLNNGDGTFEDAPYFSMTLNKYLEWIYVVDLNGDGLDDIVPYFINYDSNSSWKSKTYAYINQGDTFQFVGEKSCNKYFTMYPGDFCNEKKHSFYVVYSPTLNETIYSPEIFYYGTSLASKSLGLQATIGVSDHVFVADIDSDGRAEIMVLKDSYAVVANISKDNNNYVFNRLYSDYNFNDDDYLFAGDFNSDGHDDVLRYDNVSYWKVSISDGHNLQTPVSCMANTLFNGLTLAPQDRYSCSLQNLSRPSVTIRTADFDGDGKTDVAVFQNTGGNYYVTFGFKMHKNTNNSYTFEDIRRFYFLINNSHQYVHVGNFLGRENSSILSTVKSNPYTNEFPKIVSLYPQSSRYSVERITDGLGNAHGFKYKYLLPNTSDSFYGFDYQLVNDNIRTITIPVTALCADTVFSVNNHPCVTCYSYKNMLYHRNGKGYMGFEETTSRHKVNNMLFETKTNKNNMNLLMEQEVLLPQSLDIYNHDNQLVAFEHYEYLIPKCIKNVKIVMPLLSQKNVVKYDPDSPGSIMKINVENIDYQSDMTDGYYSDVVNVHREALGEDGSYSGDDATSCAFWSEKVYDYNNDIGIWAVMRPQSIIKSYHYADNDQVGNCEIYEYSSNNPFKACKTTFLPNVEMNLADPLKIVAEYSYDAVGNVVTQSLTSPSAKSSRVTGVRYDKKYNYRLPTSSINEKGWEVYSVFDNNYGMLNSTVDYNSFQTNTSSDPFEISVENTMPGGVTNIKTKRWAVGNKYSPSGATFYIWEKSSGKAENMVFYSKKGLKMRKVSFGLENEPIYTDYTYDDFGNMTSQSNPYKPGDIIHRHYYVYDNNNRLVEEIFPNGLTKTFSYNKLQNTICSVSSQGVAHTVVETYNPVGWRTQVVDIGGNVIDYDYYSDGKLKSAMIGNNTATKVKYEYDHLRNVSKMKDPAYGEVLYEYNAFGELVSTTTPQKCVTTYDYDALGNVVLRKETDSKGGNTVVTQWCYDETKGKRGMLAYVTYGQAHKVEYDYDKLLRVSSVRETIRDASYSTSYTYDKANREEIISYPIGLTMRKIYSNSGLYMSMADASNDKMLWRTNAADAMGYVVDYQLGNGLKAQRIYDAKTGLLNSIYTFSDNNVYQNMAYSYDDFGNLLSRAKANGANKIESFAYDEFNRLVEIKMNDEVTGNMEYDAMGNILSKTAERKDVFYDAQYSFSKPYAIKRAKSDDKKLIRANQNISYTSFDKISNVFYDNNSLSIDYNFDHERVHMEEFTDGVYKEKTYVTDCEYVTTNGKTIVYTYLEGPTGVFAVVCTDEKGVNSIKYIHKDHLDSWCMVTDEQGKTLQNVSFDAWGNPRNGDSWSGDYNGNLLCDRGFTGHEHLTAFGIINMNGRAYDPVMSMMMSPDNYIQNLDFSQNFNRYIYCYNNPLSYSDPTGEWVEWLLWGVFQGTMNVINNCDEIDGFKEGALAFGAGFVSGCLSMGFSECSWALQVVSATAGETLKSGVNYIVKKNDDKYHIDWSVVEDKTFQSDIMYALGSNLAKSALHAYIVQPDDDNEEGVTLANKLCHNKVDRMVFETSTTKIAGNLFAGKKMFDGFNCKNWNDFAPYAKCITGIMWDGLQFERGSAKLTAAVNEMIKIDISGNMRKASKSMNNCYSRIQSLFLKNCE